MLFLQGNQTKKANKLEVFLPRQGIAKSISHRVGCGGPFKMDIARLDFLAQAVVVDIDMEKLDNKLSNVIKTINVRLRVHVARGGIYGRKTFQHHSQTKTPRRLTRLPKQAKKKKRPDVQANPRRTSCFSKTPAKGWLILSYLSKIEPCLGFFQADTPMGEGRFQRNPRQFERG